MGTNKRQRTTMITLGNIAKSDVDAFRVALQDRMPSEIRVRNSLANDGYAYFGPQSASVIVIADGSRRTVPRVWEAEARTFFAGWVACLARDTKG